MQGENARHLQVLSLNDNAITDLTPLAELPLTNLSATNNAIASIPDSFEVDVLTLDGNAIAGGPAISLGRVPTATRYEPGPNGSVQAHVEYEWVLEMATEVGYHFRLQASSDLRRWESVPGHENVVGDGLRYRVPLPLDMEDWRYFRRVAARPQ